MKNPCDGHVTSLRVLVIVMALLAVSSFLSCRHEKVGGHAREPQYVQLDSSLSRMTDVDSLSAYVNQSHERNDALAECLALKYLGKTLRKQSRFPEAIEAHTRGYELATALCDTLEMIAALDYIGTAHRRTGDMSIANGYYLKALHLCDTYSDKESPEAVKCQVVTLNGLGNIEIELHHFVTADSIFRQALQGEKSLGSNEGIAMNYANLGTIKHELGEIDSAWFYYREALRYNQLNGNKGGVARCHYGFGELYEKERSFSRALVEYKQAYDTLRQQSESWHWLDPCLGLAEVNLLLGEEAEARRYLLEAEDEAERISSKEHQAKAYELHYQLSLLEGDSKAALGYFIQSDQLYDSIYGLEKSEEMRCQRIDYQALRKSGEMDSLNKDITHLKNMRNRLLLFGVLSLLLALAVIGALVYAMRVRLRTQRLMSQVDETRSLFFTNVVHQLRSPLTAMMGAIDNITIQHEGDSLPESQRMNVEVIERQGRNLLLLMDRILEVGSVRSAIRDLEWSTVDASAFLRMIVESYQDSAVNRHIELTYAPNESSVDIDTVPSYLKTIMCSLIENAINYCNDFGKIMITSRIDGSTMTIRVADNGMGISKKDLPHVFEPFYRGGTAEQLVDGIGIGLTVVRDMTMAMGGSVAVDSVEEQGAEFTVKLPCRHAGSVKRRLDELAQPARDWVRRTQRENPLETMPSNGEERPELPVVLIVEDHTDVARMVGCVLEQDYVIHYATDGEQGLAKMCDILPDLIVTDVRMPLMDGIEMCRIMRNLPQLCHIPVVMLSARTSDDDRVRGVEAGADAYLVKPFVREELLAWAKHLVDSRRKLREVFTTPPEQLDGPVSPTNGNGNSDETFLVELTRELDKQFASGRKVDLDEVARAFKMGETQLRRKIQAVTGKNVPAFITQLRMEKALRLLQECPDCLIGDIAEQCGFQDVAYFSRVFRQHYGMTPSQARVKQ